MKTLVYVGANQGGSLAGMYNQFDVVYAFEPDPEMFEVLSSRFGEYDNVNLINAACGKEDGNSILYVMPNRVSTALGEMSDDHPPQPQPPKKSFNQIQVDVVNLGEFLEEEGIDYIDLYYSDAQGSDYDILETMKSFIENKKIGQLFVETHSNGVTIYDGLNNQFYRHQDLLSDNYEFVYASLDGRKLNDYIIPEGATEWDSCWRVK